MAARPTDEILGALKVAGTTKLGIREVSAILALIALVGGGFVWITAVCESGPREALKTHRTESLRSAHSQAVSRDEIKAEFVGVQSKLEHVTERLVDIKTSLEQHIVRTDRSNRRRRR